MECWFVIRISAEQLNACRDIYPSSLLFIIQQESMQRCVVYCLNFHDYQCSDSCYPRLPDLQKRTIF